jgi:hypothetical protein
MGAFPNHFSKPEDGFRVTRAKPGGNAGKPASCGRKILPLAASIAGEGATLAMGKIPILLGFRDGTAFAHS